MRFFKISEAAAIGLHAMALLALKKGDPLPMHHIAKVLTVSAAHCSKVMQRLARAELVKAIRGPSGGYILTRPATQIRLADIVVAIEGPLEDAECLFRDGKCRFEWCAFEQLFGEINEKARVFFESTTLAAAADMLNKVSQAYDF